MIVLWFFDWWIVVVVMGYNVLMLNLFVIFLKLFNVFFKIWIFLLFILLDLVRYWFNCVGVFIFSILLSLVFLL